MRRAVLALAGTAAGVTGVLLYRSPSTVQPIGAERAPVGPTPSPSASPSETAATVASFTGPRVPAFQKKMGYVFGVVQVVVRISNGRMTSIAIPVAPPVGDTGGRGTQPITASITDFALPILKKEALAGQTAQIHTVSGATYTAEAFMSSLQGALALARR